MINIHTHNLIVTDSEISVVSLSIAKDYEYDKLSINRFYSIGLHPWDVIPNWKSLYADKLELVTRQSSVIAIGEVGLDKLRGGLWGDQLEAFEFHVRLSEARRLPLIIHMVRAMPEILAFKKELKPHQPWIIHGFRGNRIQAQQLCRLGFYLSIGGKYSLESVQNIPIKYLFLETDESDIPLSELYHRIALLRQMSVDELALQMKKNFQTVFFDSSPQRQPLQIDWDY